MNYPPVSRREFLKKSAAAALSIPFMGGLGCTSGGGGGDAPATADTSVTVDSRVDTLLKNGIMIDVKTGESIPDRMILIKNGRILDIIGGGLATGIIADKIYDLQGNYVTPGLINAHTHMSMPCSISVFDLNVLPELIPQFYLQSRRNALECIRHGVTTVRDMGAMYNITQRLQEHIASGEIGGPRIITSSVLDVTGSFMSAAFGILADPYEACFQPVNHFDQAPDAVADAIRDGRGWIKLYHQTKRMAIPLPPFLIMGDTLARAICDEARRQGIPVAQHLTDSTGLAKGLNAGVTTFEHMMIDREFTTDELQRIIDDNIAFIPTVTVAYALCYRTKEDPDWSIGVRKLIADERHRLMPDMIDEYLTPDWAAAMHATFANYNDPDYFSSIEMQEPVKLNPDAFIGVMTNGVNNMNAIYAEGAKIGCGNDGGMPFIFPGALGLEMHLLNKIGYAPADILKMATINNAEILGLSKDLGSIEKGKIADLAVFARNPLESFENAFHARYVFQAGEQVAI